MADRLDLSDGADDRARLLGREPGDHVLDRAAQVADGCGVACRDAVGATQRDDRLAADALDLPARELLIGMRANSLGVRAHQLELDRRRAGVDDEDVHIGTPPLRIVASLVVSMFPPETTQTTLPPTR